MVNVTSWKMTELIQPSETVGAIMSAINLKTPIAMAANTASLSADPGV
jgi:hypothetical protein